MSTLRGRSHVGPDGTLRIPLPGVSANEVVEYTLEFHLSGESESAKANVTPRVRSGAARKESLRRVIGAIDDPTFERLPQGEYEQRESLD